MKKSLIIALWIIFFVSCLAFADEWNTIKSIHFIVYFRDGLDDFAEQVVEKVEKLYDQIAEYLGFRRYNFWLWDKRAKVFIYRDAEDYHTQTAQPGWSTGCVLMREKKISTYPSKGNFLDSVLPHEMGHIVFREFVGFDNPNIPLWLDEGVAGYQEPARRFGTARLVRKAIRDGKFLDINELATFNPHSCLDSGLVDIFYAEAISIVDYLIKNFGRDKFVRFCQELRDTQSSAEGLERSLSRVYNFRGLQELSQSWLKHINR